MRRVFLLRHAKSSWDDVSVDDFDRPLNGRGRRNAKAMAGYFKQAGIHPAEVLCSAALRTVQTLELLEQALPGASVSIEADLYEANKGDLLARLRRLDDRLNSVLVIGHNPGVGRLAQGLAGGQGDHKALAHLGEKYPTGTLAVLETEIARWGELEDGACRLTAFVRPGDISED
jgi:phosphohistidine phosphatase